MVHGPMNIKIKLYMGLFLFPSIFDSLYRPYKAWLNWSSVGSVVTGLRAGGSEVRMPAGAQKYFSAPKRPGRLRSPLCAPFGANCSSFHWRKAASGWYTK